MSSKSLTVRTGGLLLAACVAIAAPGFVSQASAAKTVTNDNSSITVRPKKAKGLTKWDVDGVNELKRESLFFSIGDGAPEAISTLDNTSNKVVGSVLTDAYSGDGFTLDVVYDLIGGSAGSGSSAIAETVVIDNTTDASLDLHVYDYTALKVGGTAKNNVVTASGSPVNTIDQTNPATGAVGEVDAVNPSHYEIAPGHTLLSALNGANPVTLSDSTITGKGNTHFAFEWDSTLAAQGQPNSSFIISINKTISPGVAVPLPAGAWMGLTTLGGLALVGVARRRPRAMAAI